MWDLWNQEAALDLQSKAEEYLLEHKPKGYERSARAKEEAEHIRLEVGRAYYWRDLAEHKKAIDKMVLSSLRDYANWLGERRGEASADRRITR
jgi:hypothetical protein